MIPLRDDNPSSTSPVVTMGLIGACVIVFALELLGFASIGEEGVYRFALVPAALTGNVPWGEGPTGPPAFLTLFTSMFLHGGFLHLAGNMLYLWIFGDNVEDAMGRPRFLIFYGLCGVAAALAFALPNAGSMVPMVGASGAISGVLGAYVLLYPRARVLVLIPIFIIIRIVYVPAWLVLGFWFLMQLLSAGASGSGAGGGVAFGAHVGGFVAGMALVGLFKKGDRGFGAPRRRDPPRVIRIH